MTPLERAAIAAQKADGAYRHENGQWMKEGGLVGDDHWLDIARAVIEAIREPTDEMCGDVHDTLLYAVKGEELGTAAIVWERMVETALGT